MVAEPLVYQERIVQDPEVMTGKPVIRGTRIPVERVVAHLAYNPDLDDLFASYPELSREDVQAALSYAHAKLTGRRPERQLATSVSSLGT